MRLAEMRYNLHLWLRNRSLGALICFILCVLLGVAFFIGGIYFLQASQSELNQKSSNEQAYETKQGQEQFNVPDVLDPNTTTSFIVYCNVTSTSLTINSPTLIYVWISYETRITYDVGSIDVSPSDAIEYFPFNYNQSGPQLFANILLWPQNFNLTALADQPTYENFQGHDEIVFQAAETLNLKITVHRIPRPAWENFVYQTNSDFDPEYTTNVSISPIIIGSQPSTQQLTAREALNAQIDSDIGLFLFGLIFGAAGFAVAAYGRIRKKENRNGDYE